MSGKKSIKMGNKQYQDFRKAQSEGDNDRAARIYGLGYQPEYTPSMLYIETEVVEDEPKITAPADENKVELDEDAVLADVAAGLDNKEITEKYGISAQKLGSIKKKAK